MTAGHSGKLRVGLLLDSVYVPAWAYRMLHRISSSQSAEISLVVLNGTPRESISLVRKAIRLRRRLLYLAYSALDRKLFRQRPDAFESQDVTGLIENVPRIQVTPMASRHADRFASDDLERLRAHSIDVFLRLGFRILRGGILDLAPYGVWSFHHGDNTVNRGGPAGFWEVFNRRPVTGSILQRLTENLDDGVVLYRSHSATDPFSVHRNRNNYYWKSLSFVSRVLDEIWRSGPDDPHPARQAPTVGPTVYSAPLYRPPANLRFAGMLASHLVRKAGATIGRSLHQKEHLSWMLLFDLSDSPSRSLWQFRPLTPPKGRFWADPHVLWRDGRYYVFFEDYCIADKRGRISVLTIDESGECGESSPALTLPYHVSYPCVFEWNGGVYMVPETSANRTLELYLCTEFPNRWELHGTLMSDIVAVDPTVCFQDGRSWLFANVRENEGASTWDELFLFSAADPLSSQWEPHPRNPVISDVRRARPAGKLFRQGGRLYRPSQDCSADYGYAVRINEVTTLTSTDYREVERTTITPSWNDKVTGIHTWSQEGRLVVVDARIRRSRLR